MQSDSPLSPAEQAAAELEGVDEFEHLIKWLKSGRTPKAEFAFTGSERRLAEAIEHEVNEWKKAARTMKERADQLESLLKPFAEMWARKCQYILDSGGRSSFSPDDCHFQAAWDYF